MKQTGRYEIRTKKKSAVHVTIENGLAKFEMGGNKYEISEVLFHLVFSPAP